MRIADICEFYSPQGGGVRTYVHARWKAAAAAGHEVSVIAPSARSLVTKVTGGALVEVKAPRHPVDPKYHIFWSAAPVHAALDRIAPDLIEASSPWRGAWLAALYPRSVPRTLFMHEEPVEKWGYGLFERLFSRRTIDRRIIPWLWAHLKRLYEHFDRLLCAAPSTTERLRQAGVRRIATVPLGVEADLFSPANRDETLRRELLKQMRLPPAAALLLGVGRHNWEKRWPVAIEAVQRLGLAHDAGFAMLGSGPTTRALRRRFGGNPHVMMMEPVSGRQDYARILASADIMVSTGIETFGLAAAEAVASGVPVAAPRGGAVAAFCEPGFSELHRLGDPRDASAALARLLTRLPQARAAAAAAAAHVRTLDRHFDEVFALYMRLTEDGAAEKRAPLHRDLPL